MIAAASGSLENGSTHCPEIKIGQEMTEAKTSLGSLRICVDRDTAYEQNEMPTPRVECWEDIKIIPREISRGGLSWKGHMTAWGSKKVERSIYDCGYAFGPKNAYHLFEDRGKTSKSLTNLKLFSVRLKNGEQQVMAAVKEEIIRSVLAGEDRWYPHEVLVCDEDIRFKGMPW